MAQIFLETWKLSQEAEIDFNLFLLIEVVTCLSKKWKSHLSLFYGFTLKLERDLKPEISPKNKYRFILWFHLETVNCHKKPGTQVR